MVEEKASRVVEVILSTIRPRNLLAGKVIGIGLLGLGNLLLTVGIGLVAAQVTGAIDVDGAIIGAAALALAWFIVGYAFYACAFACAGALVPRQEELQSTMTPLTLIILVAFFVSFAVLEDPDGTLAHVTAFIPMTAPMTMPPRIVTGDAPPWEIVASLAVTIGASLALIPLAARIYEGGILRTGSSLKLREAWRAGPAPRRRRRRRPSRRSARGGRGRARPCRRRSCARPRSGWRRSVSWLLIRRTSSIATIARSTSARRAEASSPSAPPLAITHARPGQRVRDLERQPRALLGVVDDEQLVAVDLAQRG